MCWPKYNLEVTEKTIEAKTETPTITYSLFDQHAISTLQTRNRIPRHKTPLNNKEDIQHFGMNVSFISLCEAKNV